MQEQATLWARIQPGNYVRGKDGAAWYIEAFDVDKGFLLRNRQGKTAVHYPQYSDPVTQLVPTHDEALATVTELLGARVYAEIYPKRPMSCRARYDNLDDFKNHLLWEHGIYAKSGKGSRNPKYLAHVHAEAHQDVDALRLLGVPHLHDLKTTH